MPTVESSRSELDVVVIGGGLAGLTAAALLARGGRRVELLESARVVGGRATTEIDSRFHLNLGAHALYRRGEAARVLRSLGIVPKGHVPPSSGLFAWSSDALHRLPATPISLMRTSLLSVRDKMSVARLMVKLPWIRSARWQKTTSKEWLDRTATSNSTRQLLEALFRVATYSNAPQTQSAAVSLSQLQLAVRHNVDYLDGGWQTLVDDLQGACTSAGARITTSVAAEEVTAHEGWTVRCSDGRVRRCKSVILATPPSKTALLASTAAPALKQWLGALEPVRVTCIDLGLRRLPRPDVRFVLGIDRPLYFSVHSASARLAPENGALVHTIPVPRGRRKRARERARRLARPIATGLA